MLADYRQRHPGLRQLILRPGTVLGEGTRNQITALFERKRILAIAGSDSPFVFIWDRDVAEVIARGVTERTTGVYNLAGDGVEVIGAVADAHRLPPLTRQVTAGDPVAIGTAGGVVWDVSGHTRGHVAFVFDGFAFTGDSLMSLGCGRLFEGTPEQMWHSLSQFADLPDATLICSGHEYTAANAPLRCLRPSWVIHARINIAVKSVFPRLKHVPR